MRADVKLFPLAVGFQSIARVLDGIYGTLERRFHGDLRRLPCRRLHCNMPIDMGQRGFWID